MPASRVVHQACIHDGASRRRRCARARSSVRGAATRTAARRYRDRSAGSRTSIHNPQSTIRNTVAEALESRAQMLRLISEAEAEIVVHAEMVAGHDEHALFEPQPRGERR